jgi:hypothetical protein
MRHRQAIRSPLAAAEPCAWIILGALALIFTPSARPDDELDAHVQSRLAFIQDPARSVRERAVALLELAATLDRAARSAADPRAQRAAWERAELLLAEFNQAQAAPDPERSLIRLQQGVAAWAQARAELAEHERNVPDPRAASRSIPQSLDRAITRLSGWIAPYPEIEANRVYRLARARFDRAGRAPDALLRSIDLQAAQRLLLTFPPSPALDGHAALLASEIARELGQWEAAQRNLVRAEQAAQPPRPIERLEARFALLLARSQLEPAEQLINQADLPEADRRLKLLEICLARLARPAGNDADRVACQKEAIRLAESLESSTPELLPRLSARVVHAIEEPADPQDASIWMWLLRARHRLGQLDRAAAIALRAITALEPDHQVTETSAPVRLEAARAALDAGRPETVLDLIAPLLKVPPPGPTDAVAQACWLHVLARSRMLDRERTPQARDAYLHALEAQIDRFPDQPRTHQARVILAQERLREDRPDQALALWSAIPAAAPEWFEAQIARFDYEYDVILSRLEQLQTEPARVQWRDTLNWVDRTRVQALPGSGSATRLALAGFWLNLMPTLGDIASARRLLDSLPAPRRASAELPAIEAARIALTIASGDFLAAERSFPAWLRAASVDQAYPLARWLAGWLRLTASDRVRQRAGPVLLALAEHYPDRAWPSTFPVSQAFSFRMIGLSASGDHAAVLKTWKAWQATGQLTPADRMRAASVLLSQGSANDAHDAYLALERAVTPGSEAWYLARLGRLRSLVRSGRDQDAGRLIEATRLLHPELGGPAFRAQFQDLERGLNRRSRGSRS